MKTLFVVNCIKINVMKFGSVILTLVLLVGLQSCKKNDDDDQQNNPNIPNVAFDTGGLINTNLPQFNQMQFPGNFVILNAHYGFNGVVVYYAGGTNYSAFELSDPAHPLTTCSALTVDGISASCDCNDTNSYNIIIGLAEEGTISAFPLKRYFVEATGNIIRVFNN